MSRLSGRNASVGCSVVEDLTGEVRGSWGGVGKKSCWVGDGLFLCMDFHNECFDAVNLYDVTTRRNGMEPSLLSSTAVLQLMGLLVEALALEYPGNQNILIPIRAIPPTKFLLRSQTCFSLFLS